MPTRTPAEQWVHTAPTDYLLCRTLRHAWRIEFYGKAEDDPDPTTSPVYSGRTVVRRCACTRCGTVRRERFPGWHATSTGKIATPVEDQPIARTYRYPYGIFGMVR